MIVFRQDWRDHFDFVVFNSMKGGFFTSQQHERPFYHLGMIGDGDGDGDGDIEFDFIAEDHSIQRESHKAGNELCKDTVYAQGSVHTLMEQEWFGKDAKV